MLGQYFSSLPRSDLQAFNGNSFPSAFMCSFEQVIGRKTIDARDRLRFLRKMLSTYGRLKWVC